MFPEGGSSGWMILTRNVNVVAGAVVVVGGGGAAAADIVGVGIILFVIIGWFFHCISRTFIAFAFSGALCGISKKKIERKRKLAKVE